MTACKPSRSVPDRSATCPPVVLNNAPAPRAKAILAALCVAALTAVLPGPASAQPPMPPRQAVQACVGLGSGDTCTLPSGMAGSCGMTPGGLACVPQGRGPGLVPSGVAPRPGGMTPQDRTGRPETPSSMHGGSMGHADGAGPGRRPQAYPENADSSPLAERDPIPTRGVPDTNQRLCFDESKVIACPARTKSSMARTPSTPGRSRATATTGTARSRTGSRA